MLTSPYLHRVSGEANERLQATAHRRLNVGCGEWPLFYWTNLDADPSLPADIHATVPPIPCLDASLDDIYAGHLLEHLTFEDGCTFLSECYRCLVPGGRLGVVVPDTREIMRRWLRGDIDQIGLLNGDGGMTYWPVADLDAVCAVFLYSTVQASPHRWSYDAGTLRRAGERAGFVFEATIDRYADPRISIGQWFQCGADFRKLGGSA